MKRRFLSVIAILAACLAPLWAQITPSDVLFAGLSARSRQMPYEQAGGDMKQIAPLMAEAAKAGTQDAVKAYLGYTQSLAMMNEGKWTPDTELSTALDFTIHAKVIGEGEYLQSRAAFLFDAPAAAQAPYRIDLEILKSDGSKVAVVPGIELGDVRGRRAGESIGVTFDPSKLAGPGLHTLRATLKDSNGAAIYEYFRTFAVIRDLSRRLTALEKMVELSPDQKSPAISTARYILEMIRAAHVTYLGGNYQNLVGYIHNGYRARNMAMRERLDFDAELDRAARLAAVVQDKRDPLDGLKGDIRLAYRSSFDGKLVPYRVYLPSGYDPAKRYPLILLLHGAGGDENNFFDSYSGLWPKLAEARGYILAAANGRGPTSGYARENGGEQDVMDVLGLLEKNYSVEPSRVYLAGHSMGAAGTWRLGLEYRDRFAALAPIAGSRWTPALETALKSGRKIPVAVVAGVKDALVPVAGCRETAEKTKALGYEVKYLEYANGDHLTVAVMSIPDVFDWFETQPQPRMNTDKHR